MAARHYRRRGAAKKYYFINTIKHNILHHRRTSTVFSGIDIAPSAFRKLRKNKTIFRGDMIK
ncbi:MAG: hypothetical protein PHQ27_04750 [Victivallales bacterium]|nr:hypothetical protein [Victivallales bacterium]